MSEPTPILIATSISTPILPSLPSLSLSLPPSTILCIRGPSGIGKSVLLKTLSLLIPPSSSSSITLHGNPPSHYGVPTWRSKILYVPQRFALLPNTPREFWEVVKGFSTKENKEEELGDPVEVGREWTCEEELWDRPWSSLSGGEGQRLALAIGVALRPDVLLLDEPTSALDHATTLLVEKTLTRPFDASGKRQAIIWVTHADEQERRVADLVLEIHRAEGDRPGGGEVRIPVHEDV